MIFRKRIGSAAALGVAMLIGAGVTAPPAEAAYVVTLEQDGANVVATGIGTIDLAGLSLDFSQSTGSSMDPSVPEILTGEQGDVDLYNGVSGPTNFGCGGLIYADSASGDPVALDTSMGVGVPAGYVSGSALSDTATYDSATLSSLGVRPGVYKWTWGSGADADNFTLIAGAVPEPSTWALLLAGFGGLVMVSYRRTRKLASIG